MTKQTDSKEREEEVLLLVVESYIRESKPISSAYLCQKYRLGYSPATVRHVLEVLEDKGFLCHPHTSAGRVPTQRGFKTYADRIQRAGIVSVFPLSITMPLHFQNNDETFEYVSDSLSQASGYTSLVAVSGKNNKVFSRGTRFMLEQPEFEDIHKIKAFFLALETRMKEIEKVLFENIDDDVRFFIGDEIGCKEIADCSLIVAHAKEKALSFSLALLGPMRMDYMRAASCLQGIKQRLMELIENEE